MARDWDIAADVICAGPNSVRTEWRCSGPDFLCHPPLCVTYIVQAFLFELSVESRLWKADGKCINRSSFPRSSRERPAHKTWQRFRSLWCGTEGRSSTEMAGM